MRCPSLQKIKLFTIILWMSVLLFVSQLRKHFFIVREEENYEMGADPMAVLTRLVEAESGKYVNVLKTGNGVLIVMKEGFPEKSVKFLPKSRFAVGIKYSKDSLEIAERLSNIGFILFHTRKDKDQHLFRVSNKVEVLSNEEINHSMYKNVGTTEMYAYVQFEIIELDSNAFAFCV